MRIAFLPDAETSAHWHEIKEYLEPAARVGGIKPVEPGDLVWLALDGEAIVGAFTSELEGSALKLKCLGGRWLSEWVGMAEDAMSRFARDCGATRIEGGGRTGWGRFAARFGWKLSGKTDNGKPLWAKEL